MVLFAASTLSPHQAMIFGDKDKSKDHQVDVVWASMVLYSGSIRPYGVSTSGFTGLVLAFDEGGRLSVLQFKSFHAPHPKGSVGS